MLTLLLAVLMGAAPKSGAAVGAFYDCDISSGQPIRCGDTYQGKAVVDLQGGIQECSIKDGALTACDGPFQGRAVVPYQGIFQECDVADGQVSRCISWLDEGRGAVWKGTGKPAPPKVAPKKDPKDTKDPKDPKKDGKKPPGKPAPKRR